MTDVFTKDKNTRNKNLLHESDKKGFLLSNFKGNNSQRLDFKKENKHQKTS